MKKRDLIYSVNKIETKDEISNRRFHNVCILMLVIFLMSILAQILVPYTELRKDNNSEKMNFREDLTGRQTILINLNETTFVDIEDERSIKVRVNARSVEGFIKGKLYVKVGNGDIIELSAPGKAKSLFRVCLE